MAELSFICELGISYAIISPLSIRRVIPLPFMIETVHSDSVY